MGRQYHELDPADCIAVCVLAVYTTICTVRISVCDAIFVAIVDAIVDAIYKEKEADERNENDEWKGDINEEWRDGGNE